MADSAWHSKDLALSMSVYALLAIMADSVRTVSIDHVMAKIIFHELMPITLSDRRLSCYDGLFKRKKEKFSLSKRLRFNKRL